MKYEVTRYYSSFVVLNIEADSEEDAYLKSKELSLDLVELQNNLEEWKEADEIKKVEEDN